MKKQYILIALFSFIMFGMGFINFTQAAIDPIPGVDIIVKPGTGGLVTANTYSGIVSLNAGDLKVDNVGTLPTSNFYFLKQWGRGITRFFTFNPIAKAELELNITNQIAAEALEVEKASPNDTKALKNALQNFTDAQKQLNSRITAISVDSTDANLVKLLKEVDEKTLKHAELLGQLAERWNNDPYAEGSAKKLSIGDPDFDLLRKTVKDAQNNAEITFTATVTSGSGTATPTGSESVLKQKATDEIANAEEVVKKVSTSVYGQDVTFTATLANAKDHLQSARESFAEGKYGEAYGLARSAEAMVTRKTGTQDSDNQAAGEKTSQGTLEISNEKQTKIGENESPLPSTRSLKIPVVRPQETTETIKPVDSTTGNILQRSSVNNEYDNSAVQKIEPIQAVTEPATAPEQTLIIQTSASLGGSGTVGSIAPVETEQAKKYGVSIVNFSFSPVTLNINKGDTVVWTNNDSAPHTVTGNDSKALSSATLSIGQSYSFTFTESGAFDYHCAIHPTMRGSIIVK
jgi:plastocyanin